MGIGADLLVRFLDECGEIGFPDGPVPAPHSYCQTETATLARTYRHRASHLGTGGVLLLLFGNEVERAAETGRVTRGEQVLGRRRSGLAWPAHFLGDRKVDLYQTVA